MRVAAFYRFARFSSEEIEPLRARLLALGRDHGVLGTVLLAEEGVNGTISGPEAGVDTVLAHLRRDPRLADLAIRRSSSDRQPFFRLKVKRKREIVSLGIAGADPLERVGAYVPPAGWNALVRDPRTLLIDTRNSYEVEVGTFPGAIHPGSHCFRDFPTWVERELPALLAARQPERLALFCTGGIRCEKATAHLLGQGFSGVHHLQGGILGYLEATPPEQSLWQGECFVFDQRAALNHQLLPGSHALCHACRMPLSEADRQLPSYIPGVGCRHCDGHRSPVDRNRYAERQRQQQRAMGVGERHLGRSFPLTGAP
ncbi:MAG: rhodanese-related sulfurtransferase [Cyanobacteriota bacterium]|nr:rhodanese-related sulfurtransferase [Cyanobacteriota bacterium]